MRRKDKAVYVSVGALANAEVFGETTRRILAEHKDRMAQHGPVRTLVKNGQPVLIEKAPTEADWDELLKKKHEIPKPTKQQLREVPTCPR